MTDDRIYNTLNSAFDKLKSLQDNKKNRCFIFISDSDVSIINKSLMGKGFKLCKYKKSGYQIRRRFLRFSKDIIMGRLVSGRFGGVYEN